MIGRWLYMWRHISEAASLVIERLYTKTRVDIVPTQDLRGGDEAGRAEGTRHSNHNCAKDQQPTY